MEKSAELDFQEQPVTNPEYDNLKLGIAFSISILFCLIAGFPYLALTIYSLILLALGQILIISHIIHFIRARKNHS